MTFDPVKVVLVYAMTSEDPQRFELLAVCSDAARAEALCQRVKRPTYTQAALMDGLIPAVAAACMPEIYGTQDSSSITSALSH